MMFTNVEHLDMRDFTNSIPSFLTLFLMVMTSSISDGILIGIISFVVINAAARKWEKLNPTIVVLAIIFVLRFILM